MQVKRLLASLSLSAVLSLGTQVFAQPTHHLSTRVATLDANVSHFEDGGYAVIRLYPGYGLTLDFSQAGEVVNKAWLDDPSRIGMDFSSDGQEDGLNSQFVHLKLIQQIEFQNLLHSADGGTLLTLITEVPTMTQRRYQFRIVPSTGVPEYTALRITPRVEIVTPGQRLIDVSPLVRARPEHVQLGLGSLLASVSPQDMPLVAGVTDNVREFLALFGNGMSANEAAERAGVSMQLVTHLAQLGLQASPSNPLGLREGVEPIDPLGLGNGRFVAPSSAPTLTPQPQRRSPMPESPPTAELNAPVASSLHAIEFVAEEPEPEPVDLSAAEERVVRRIKIGAPKFALAHAIPHDPRYQLRVERLVAYLESGRPLEEAVQYADFSLQDAEQMIALAETSLRSLDY